MVFVIGGIIVVLIILIIICYNNLVLARNKAKTNDEKGKLNSSLTSNLSSIYAIAENYPELKANESFLQLQLELTNTEEKIAGSRNSYNSAVNTYNNKIEMIPTNIVASLFHFEVSF